MNNFVFSNHSIKSVSDPIFLFSRNVTKMTITMPKYSVMNSDIFKFLRFAEIFKTKQDQWPGKIKNASQPKISLSGQITAMRY